MADEVTPGAQPAAPAQPQQAAPPAQPQVTPPPVIPVPLADLQSLMALPGQLAELQGRLSAIDRKAKDEVTAALLKQGQAEQAVENVRKQWQDDAGTLRAQQAALDTRARTYARDTAIAQALAGHNLLPGVAAEVMQLIAPHLAAEPKGDTFDVRTPNTFQGAADFVKEWIAARPHYLQSRTQGGGGPGGGGTPAPSGGQQQGEYVAPGNPGQAAFAEWLTQRDALSKAGYGGIGFGSTTRATGVGPAIAAPTGPVFGRN